MIRLLEPADDASYRALWSEAITKYGEHFRTAAEDASPAGIPTSFQQDSYTLGAFEGGALIGVVSVAREQGASSCGTRRCCRGCSSTRMQRVSASAS
jgi:hypothetical protein